MKILLDECVPVRLIKFLNDFDVSSVNKEKWTSLRNSELLKTAIDAEFDVFVTVDKSLQYQQNLNEYNITIVVFDVHYNHLQDFIQLIPKFLKLYCLLWKRKRHM